MTSSRPVAVDSAPAAARKRRSRTLTQTELQVLELLAQGHTHTAIAATLHLSSATVSYHLSNLKHRFDTTSSVTLVAAAMVHGILTTQTWPVRLTGRNQFHPPDQAA